MPNFTSHFAVPSVARGLAIVRNFANNLFRSGVGGEPGGISVDPDYADVRVEASGQGSTTLRWDYNGLTATVGIYRSTDGITFTLIDTVASTVFEYIDEDLEDHTKYWYRVSADAGLTASDPVTVVTYMVSSGSGSIVNATVMTARRAKQAYASQKDFNELVLQLEQEENVKSVERTPCDVCLVDMSIIIDCTTGCEWFRVIMDEDINSISLIGCDDCPNIDFIIPPETIRGICGWPIGCDYEGDECFEGPINGGPNGRTAKTHGGSYEGYGPSPQNPSSGGGSDGCQCTPNKGRLAIKCCGAYEAANTPQIDPDHCFFDCFNVADDDQQQIKFKACGGLPMYTWRTNYPEYLRLDSENSGLSMTATWIDPVRVNSCFAGTPNSMYERILLGLDNGAGPAVPLTITVTDMTYTSVTKVITVAFP